MINIKDINSESPKLRDEALMRNLPRYAEYSEPLIDPIGVGMDIYLNKNLTDSISPNGLLAYTNDNSAVKVNNSNFRDLSVDSVVEYDKIVDLYTKDDTYLDLVEKNWFGIATNAVSSILTGGGVGIGMDSTGKLNVSTTFVQDTLVTRGLNILSGNETKLGELGAEYLGISLANSIIAKGTTAFDKWMGEPLGFMDAVDELDSVKLDNFVGSVFPIYLYTEVKKAGNDYFERFDNKNENNFSWMNLSTNLVETNGSKLETSGGEDISNKQSLLYKTQQMFKSGKINSLITYFDNKKFNNSSFDPVVTKGRALTKKNDDNKYCRAWTVNSQYRHMNNLIRPFSNELKSVLDKDLKRVRPGQDNLDTYGVLEKNGMVKISPYQRTNKFTNADTKQYMFSIENLAWKGHLDNIIKGSSQEGPNGGRIMWFPPYDITFNENTSVNWNSDTYIGRGEPVYSYINTERSGTLTFKLVVDHPSIINYYKQKDPTGVSVKAEDYLRFFAGCDVLDLQEDPVHKETGFTQTSPVPKKEDPKPIKYIFKIYFPNNYSGKDDQPNDAVDYLYYGDACSTNKLSGKGYEMEIGTGLSTFVPFACNGNYFYRTDNAYSSGSLKYATNYKDSTSFGLNSNKNESSYSFKDIYDAISGATSDFGSKSKLSDVKFVNISGFASSQGTDNENIKLARQRAETIQKWLKQNGLGHADFQIVNTVPILEQSAVERYGDSAKDVSSKIVKKDRRVIVELIINGTSEFANEPDTKQTGEVTKIPGDTKPTYTQPQTRPKVDMYGYSMKNGNSDLRNDEAQFFEPLKLDDDFVEQMIGEYSNKIKHFHPAFHSTTPEGMNARLTFLHQCTRQGPTNNGSTTAATNMSFGRPPVCVLRIGDFYNTKVIFNDLSINFEPLIWDLNTEGVGVQPMLANINMGFKFIGGSDLSGPISRLQNAVSFNYFANTGVYDDRNDRITKHEASSDKEGSFNDTYYNLYQPGVYGKD